MKVYCAGNQEYETSWLREMGASVVKKIEEADLVLFNGGTDVDPSIYGQRRSVYTESPDRERDKMEQEQFKYCIENDIKMCGTCRGSQFLAVMSGASLIQHVDGHTSNHTMLTNKGQSFEVGSWHHQMMYPFDVKKKVILAWSNMVSGKHIDGTNKNIHYPEDFVESEVVYFPLTKCLCIQSHPDWVEGEVREYFKALVEGLMEDLLPKTSLKYKTTCITKLYPVRNSLTNSLYEVEE